jgi:hypothetical protein
MKIIGLGHYSRTGKDSLANYLIQDLRSSGLVAKKIPFAWKLKQICHDLYAWDGLREPEFYDTTDGEKFRDIKLPTIGKTPVEIWVAMGTPAVRNNVYMDTWINFVLKSDHQADVIVIPDVRFPNEIQAVREAGGWLGKIVRPGYGPRDTVADRALVGYDGWDAVIGRSGLMSELETWALDLSDAISGNVPYPVQSREDKLAALAVEKISG